MTFAQVSELIEARPVPTPEQHMAARRYVTRNAPDLLAAIFGDNNQEWS